MEAIQADETAISTDSQQADRRELGRMREVPMHATETSDRSDEAIDPILREHGEWEGEERPGRDQQSRSLSKSEWFYPNGSIAPLDQALHYDQDENESDGDDVGDEIEDREEEDKLPLQPSVLSSVSYPAQEMLTAGDGHGLSDQTPEVMMDYLIDQDVSRAKIESETYLGVNEAAQEPVGDDAAYDFGIRVYRAETDCEDVEGISPELVKGKRVWLHGLKEQGMNGRKGACIHMFAPDFVRICRTRPQPLVFLCPCSCWTLIFMHTPLKVPAGISWKIVGDSTSF